MKRIIENIPMGLYCYDSNGVCPYWELHEDKPEQENGYCALLERGDWEHTDEIGLLWDQVKECFYFREMNDFNLVLCGEWRVKTYLRRAFARLKLWNTIPKHVSLRDKIHKYIWMGKICRCKFCLKYYLEQQDATNETCCGPCWIDKQKRRRRLEGRL